MNTTISKLSRLIKNDNGCIKLTTENLLNLEYAFYLQHKNKVEKSFYSKDNMKTFQMQFLKGFYSARFFYKTETQKFSYKLNFYIKSDGQIILKKNIIDTADHSVDFYDIGSQTTFVVFNGYGSTKQSTPFGLSFLLNKGFNVVSCLQNNNQYQSLSFNDMNVHIKPLLENHEIYLYGSSLGGYCAIYYAGALNGTVIASAPRNSAHPLLINRMNKVKQYTPESFKHHELEQNPITLKKIYIIVDPMEVDDIYYINSFIRKCYNELNIIECHFAGHEVLFHLNKTKQLEKIIDTITNKNEVNISNISSCYTNYGKAKYYFEKGEKKLANEYIKQAINDKTIEIKTLKRFELLQSKIAQLCIIK